MGYRQAVAQIQRMWYPTLKSDPGGVAGWRDLSTEDYNTTSIFSPTPRKASLVGVLIATSYNTYVTAGDWWLAFHRKAKDEASAEVYWGPSRDTGTYPGQGLWIDETHTALYGGNQMTRRYFSFAPGQHVLTPDDYLFTRLHWNASAALNASSSGVWLIACDWRED